MPEMQQSFHVEVTDSRGKKQSFRTAIGGGGQMSAEDLGKHFVEHNAFPNAKEVKIHDAPPVPAAKLNDRLRAAVTPAATVVRSGPAPAVAPAPAPAPAVAPAPVAANESAVSDQPDPAQEAQAAE